MIEISVVIPTHNRSQVLAKNLSLFKEQSLEPEKFEVIVSADGCTDGTAEIVKQVQVPYQLSVIEKHPATGAAGARNRGAAVAKADILLFLDDDMEPTRDLLRAHLATHRSTPNGVVLGYYPMPSPQRGESHLVKFARVWWAERFAERAKPDYRFSFYDLCTGNVSIAKHAFLSAGGFDEIISCLGAGEDYELGYRLIRQRIPFHYAPEAQSVHHSNVTLPIHMRRMKEDGYGQALMTRKHPELFWEFNVSRLSRLSDSTLLRPLWLALWKFPMLTKAPMSVVSMMARTSLAMNVDSLFQRLHRLLKAHAYWQGVVAALGSVTVWERLRQDAPVAPPEYREVDLDVAQDLQCLEEFMESHWPVDAIRVYASGEPVGRIAPRAAYEALNASHVRSMLVNQFGSVLLAEVVRRRHSTTYNFGSPASAGSDARSPEVNDQECQSRNGELHLSQ